MSKAEPAEPLRELIGRSNRLGSDRRNTNYGGGNTSAKGLVADPASADEVDVMWVKGSGGDLATLTSGGVSALRLDRVRALKDQYVDVSQEDELHQLLDHCVFGPPGPAPSIDTSMHALLPAAHVDHLHPDSVIAIAASADGEALTNEIFGGEIGWVPWQRPGFDLALKIEAMRAVSPSMRGVVMGGHGVSSWADTSDECERVSLDVIQRAAAFIEQHGKPEPLGPIRSGFEPLAADERRGKAAAFAPILRELASTDRPVIGRWFDDGNVLDFIGRQETPRLAPLGTSCPDHFIRTKVRPLLLDLPTNASFEEQTVRLGELHSEYRHQYRQYYDRHAGADTPPIRGADPAIFLIPGVGMFAFGADLQTAQVAGEFYVNAINVIRGAEAVSKYVPVSEAEKFGVEYWLLEELKLRRRPAAKPLAAKVAVVCGTGSVVGRAIAHEYEEAGAVVVGIEGADVSAVDMAIESAVLEYGGVDIMVGSSAARGVNYMTAQGSGGDIVLVSESQSTVSGLATRLEEKGINVNGIVGTELQAEHVARAARALVDGSLSQTTGLVIPIRGGGEQQVGGAGPAIDIVY